jgi:murein DD-endopeptidase MepM/ murein hydrolase activator NlpD
MSVKKTSLVQKLRNKYRLIIYNDDTFEEILSYRLNRLNVVSLLGTVIIVACGALYLLIAYTPLKVYVIPDFPKADERRAIIENIHKLDSLENQMRIYSQYLLNVHTVLRGDDPDSIYNRQIEETRPVGEIVFSKSKEDSIFRKQIEEEESYNLSFAESQRKLSDFNSLDFFPPVKGMVTNSFNSSKGHFGTDIVASTDAAIHSVLDGMVVFANWTIEAGQVIHIQHEHGLLSMYMHNSKLLKKVGDRVSAGDAIAIIGNTGHVSTGPHLHFEIWKKGKPLNAEDFIIFQ